MERPENTERWETAERRDLDPAFLRALRASVVGATPGRSARWVLYLGEDDSCLVREARDRTVTQPPILE